MYHITNKDACDSYGTEDHLLALHTATSKNSKAYQRESGLVKLKPDIVGWVGPIM